MTADFDKMNKGLKSKSKSKKKPQISKKFDVTKVKSPTKQVGLDDRDPMIIIYGLEGTGKTYTSIVTSPNRNVITVLTEAGLSPIIPEDYDTSKMEKLYLYESSELMDIYSEGLHLITKDNKGDNIFNPVCVLRRIENAILKIAYDIELGFELGHYKKSPIVVIDSFTPIWKHIQEVKDLKQFGVDTMAELLEYKARETEEEKDQRMKSSSESWNWANNKVRAMLMPLYDLYHKGKCILILTAQEKNEDKKLSNKLVVRTVAPNVAPQLRYDCDITIRMVSTNESNRGIIKKIRSRNKSIREGDYIINPTVKDIFMMFRGKRPKKLKGMDIE